VAVELGLVVRLKVSQCSMRLGFCSPVKIGRNKLILVEVAVEERTSKRHSLGLHLTMHQKSTNHDISLDRRPKDYFC